MAHPCQALSSGTVQWQQGHLRAPSPGHSPSWHCHQPHRLQAGGGQQARAQHPLSWPWGLHLPRPVLKDTAAGDTSPPHCSAPSLGSPLPPDPGVGHVDVACWHQSLERSPPGLPSPDFQPLSHVAPVPFLEMGKLESWPSPSRFLQPSGPPPLHGPGGSSPPRGSVSVPMLCASMTEGSSWSLPREASAHRQVPCRRVCPERFVGSLHGQALGGST